MFSMKASPWAWSKKEIPVHGIVFLTTSQFKILLWYLNRDLDLGAAKAQVRVWIWIKARIWIRSQPGLINMKHSDSGPFNPNKTHNDPERWVCIYPAYLNRYPIFFTLYLYNYLQFLHVPKRVEMKYKEIHFFCPQNSRDHVKCRKMRKRCLWPIWQQKIVDRQKYFREYFAAMCVGPDSFA